MGNNVVGLIRRPGWIKIFTWAAELNGDYFGIMVTLLTFDQLDPGVGIQVDNGIG